MDLPAPGGPRSSLDDVIDCYKKDVDQTLLREALTLTPDERVRRLVELIRTAELEAPREERDAR